MNEQQKAEMREGLGLGAPVPPKVTKKKVTKKVTPKEEAPEKE